MAKASHQSCIPQNLLKVELFPLEKQMEQELKEFLLEELLVRKAKLSALQQELDGLREKDVHKFLSMEYMHMRLQGRVKIDNIFYRYGGDFLAKKLKRIDIISRSIEKLGAEIAIREELFSPLSDEKFSVPTYAEMLLLFFYSPVFVEKERREADLRYKRRYIRNSSWHATICYHIEVSRLIAVAILNILKDVGSTLSFVRR